MEGDIKALVYVSEKSDFSTFVHEAAHVARRTMQGELLQQAEKAFGVTDGKWTRETEERFARGFEQYLKEGKAPSAELKNIFQKAAEFLARIYKSLKELVHINDDIRAVYDELLGVQGGALRQAEQNIQEAESAKRAKQNTSGKYASAESYEQNRIVETAEDKALDNAALKDKYMNYAKAHFQGNSYHNIDTDTDIRVSRDILGEWKSKTKTREQILSMQILDKLIESAVETNAVDDKENRRNIESVKYFETGLSVEDKTYKAHLTARKVQDSTTKAYHYYLEDISLEDMVLDRIKEEAALRANASSKEVNVPLLHGSITDTIAQQDDEVNSEKTVYEQAQDAYNAAGKAVQEMRPFSDEQLKDMLFQAAVESIEDGKQINRNNFYTSSYADWHEVTNAPDRKPDFKSRSGSEYWYSDEGVYRRSDHWGNVASCKWPLDGQQIQGTVKVGFSTWGDFYDMTRPFKSAQDGVYNRYTVIAKGYNFDFEAQRRSDIEFAKKMIAEEQDEYMRQRWQEDLALYESLSEDDFNAFEQEPWDTLLFQTEVVTEEQQEFAQAASKYRADIARYFARQMKSHESITVCKKTPAILRAVGFADKPITITGASLTHITNKHKAITQELLNTLPEQLLDPVAVFKSQKEDKPNSRLIFTEHFVRGKPVVVAIEMNHKDKHIQMNSIRSVYERDVYSKKGLNILQENFIDAGRLLYIDDKRADKWSAITGVSFPLEAFSKLNPSTDSIGEKAESVKPFLTKSDIIGENPEALYFQTEADFYEESTQAINKEVLEHDVEKIVIGKEPRELSSFFYTGSEQPFLLLLRLFYRCGMLCL
ncbi:hypothetical protein H0R92_05975 [Treponema sp. OMZ 840]|uniref:MuF-C-terminal domain-containing protein n=1 Tax=Treponema sp. OMZ 840 TaxID=244313 RepID=UPI003D8D0495